MWLDTFGNADTELVFYVFCGVSGLIFILSVLNLILGCSIGKNSVSVSCDFHIEIGCLFLVFTVLARGFNSVEWVEESVALEIICKIYHVILLIGLTQFIGGLFVKGWTVFLFYKYNSDKRPLSEEWIPNLLIWILILIAAAAALVWEFVFPPEYKGGMCMSPNEFEWKVGTSAWHGLLLFLALFAIPFNCSAACGTPGSREASILSVVTFNTVLTVIAGICMHFLYFEMEEDAPLEHDVMRYAVMGGLMLWMCLFADLMFVISKICHSCNKGPEDIGDNYDTIDTGSNRNSYVHPNPTYDSANGKTNETFEY